jgi:type IV pilus assembly protein PilB
MPQTATSSETSVKNKPNGDGIAKLEKTPESVKAEILNLIPEDVSKKYKIAAYERIGNVVKIAMVNPADIGALNALRFMAERENLGLEVYQTQEGIFNEIVGFYKGPTEIVQEAVKSIKDDVSIDEGDEKADTKKKDQIFQEAPVAKLVQVIISHAIEGHASDIHIEPMDKDYRVRFRVDGVLHLSLIIPREIGPAIISRIKILANLKIDERRKPQDGRFRITNDGKEIDFRVSTLPVITGEKVVMRILDKDQGLANISVLGLLGTALSDMQSAIEETYGMILFTGPTGSGKSTSLYALLKILNSEERNIITLEDPIEYNIEGLNQSQIKPEIDYTFANGLRSILRQDPNVIMVGEIRDSETAELAIHAALTGHLMFSTLHTNTASGAIPRLIDMGIEPFLLSSALRTVAAQRLVRKICSECKEEQKISDSIKQKIMDEIKNISQEELKKYELDSSAPVKFYHGKGCKACNGTGLKGRLGIFEVIPATDTIKTIINDKKGREEDIIKERERRGILTIRQDGILKVLKGLTTISEIERVTEGSMTLEEEV